MVAVAPSSSQRGAVCVGVDAIDNAVDDAEPSRSASSATGWVARLQEAHSRGKLAQELIKLRRYSLLLVDLCRARDYAEAAAVLGWFVGFRRLAALHSYRLSRNARILSVGW
jgi:hypothetical protein